MADDRELWDRIRRGEAQAFDFFYREMGPRLLGFLRQMVGNRQAAEDVMQETFTQMWRSPNGFVPERGTLRTYLFGVARKRAAEWWRNRGSAGGGVIDERTECKTEIALQTIRAQCRRKRQRWKARRGESERFLERVNCCS